MPVADVYFVGWMVIMATGNWIQPKAKKSHHWSVLNRVNSDAPPLSPEDEEYSRIHGSFQSGGSLLMGDQFGHGTGR